MLCTFVWCGGICLGQAETNPKFQDHHSTASETTPPPLLEKLDLNHNQALAQEDFKKSMQFGEAGQFEEAERYLQKALDRDPANADYHFELANIYAQRHDASKGASKNPRSSEMLSASARELEQAVMLKKDLLPAHYNLGVVYKRQGRYEEARERFKQVLSLDPQNAPATMQIGKTYEEQGFYDEAQDSYEQARDYDYTNADIVTALEDLEERKNNQQSQPQKDPLDVYRRMRGNYSYSPFGLPAQYEKNRQEALQSGADIRQAIPFLGAWLIQEFMNLKRDQDQE